MKFFLSGGPSILVHAQAETPCLALDVPARKAGLPRQFSDDAATPMEAAVVMRAEVRIVLREPHVLDVMPAPALRPAFEAESGQHWCSVFLGFFDWRPAIVAQHDGHSSCRGFRSWQQHWHSVASELFQAHSSGRAEIQATGSSTCRLSAALKKAASKGPVAP